VVKEVPYLMEGRRERSINRKRKDNPQGHTPSDLPPTKPHLPKFHHLLRVYSDPEAMDRLIHS
jgi:hypothetical protein